MKEFQLLLSNEAFGRLVESERERAWSLGERAGHQFRGEAITSVVTSMIFERLKDPDITVGELLDCYKTFALSAGLDVPPERGGSGGPTVAVQINLPSFDTGKMTHVKAS